MKQPTKTFIVNTGVWKGQPLRQRIHLRWQLRRANFELKLSAYAEPGYLLAFNNEALHTEFIEWEPDLVSQDEPTLKRIALHGYLSMERERKQGRIIDITDA